MHFFSFSAFKPSCLLQSCVPWFVSHSYFILKRGLWGQGCTFWFKISVSKSCVLNECLLTDGLKRTQCRCFSSLVSAAISTHRPPFLALMDSRSSHNAKSEQAVNQSDLRLEETPVTVLKATVRSHCLYDSLSHVFAPRAIYLPLVFVFPASNVSFLLPLNRSVNFQKPVKSPHWPHGGGSKFKQFASVYSAHASRNSAGGGKNTKASDPTSSSSLHMKKQTAFCFLFFYKLQPKLNYFLLSSS